MFHAVKRFGQIETVEPEET